MKAVLYCRISTSTSFSLDMIRGQQLRLLDYAKENGIEVTGMYLDVGYLGSRSSVHPAHNAYGTLLTATHMTAKRLQLVGGCGTGRGRKRR